MMNFCDFITRYEAQDSWRGILAKSISLDENFPKEADKVKMKDYLRSAGKPEEAMWAMDYFWKQYKAYLKKERAKLPKSENEILIERFERAINCLLAAKINLAGTLFQKQVDDLIVLISTNKEILERAVD